MSSAQDSNSMVQANPSMGQTYNQGGLSATGNQHVQGSNNLNNITTIQPQGYVAGDITSQATRQYQLHIRASQAHVKFGGVHIDSGDAMCTTVDDGPFEYREGDVLACALDREVLNTVLETGTDEKGRRALKQMYAKLPPERRRQHEIRLAQYSGFVMRSDGTLDYGINKIKKPGFIKKLWRCLL